MEDYPIRHGRLVDSTDVPPAHEMCRADLRTYARQEGWQWREFTDVNPTGPYRNYSTCFMSAMQPELSWLYQGTPVVSPPSMISTSFCVRSDRGFSDAGTRNRQLKCFEMLTLSGAMEERDALFHTLALLRLLLRDTETEIVLHVDVDDASSRVFAEEHNVRVVSDTACKFRELTKTDRGGKRVEFHVLSAASGTPLSWEVLNAVILTTAGNGRNDLVPPFVEASGSLERILAFRECKNHVLDTSAFLVLGDEDVCQILNAPSGRPFRDLLRTALVMANSQFHLPEIYAKASPRERTYYHVVREAVMLAHERGVGPDPLERMVRAMLETMRGRYQSGLGSADGCLADVHEMAQRIDGTAGRIEQYVLQRKGMVEEATLRERAAALYEGGTDRLTRLVMARSGWPGEGRDPDGS